MFWRKFLAGQTLWRKTNTLPPEAAYECLRARRGVCSAAVLFTVRAYTRWEQYPSLKKLTDIIVSFLAISVALLSIVGKPS